MFCRANIWDQHNYHLTCSEDILINMLSHLSVVIRFPFPSLTIEAQTVGPEKAQTEHKSLKSDRNNTVYHEDRGGGERFTASVLRCRRATFTSGTAVTLQHNGLLIEGRGNRRLSFHRQLRQECRFGYKTSVSDNSTDNKRQSGCLRKSGTGLHGTRWPPHVVFSKHSTECSLSSLKMYVFAECIYGHRSCRDASWVKILPCSQRSQTQIPVLTAIHSVEEPSNKVAEKLILNSNRSTKRWHLKRWFSWREQLRITFIIFSTACN